MSHVYWEKHEIPIPEDAYIDKHDGRVFIFLSKDVPTRQSKRRAIGHATSESTMHPNDFFAYYYPALWEEYYGCKDKKEHVLGVGLYALTLGIGYKTSLYPLLQKAYGPVCSNFLMDYAMYSILDESSVAMLFSESMKKRVLFSREAYSDTWISETFKKRMDRNMDHDFRAGWLDHCKEIGIKNAWICIDGSNCDCDAKDCDLAEYGHDKSGTGSKIISYMYAVSDTGLPITYTVYNGSKPDSTAFQDMASYLSHNGITVKGIILDRGFAKHNVIKLINSIGFSYVIMLTSASFAYQRMLAEHMDEVRWNVKKSALKHSIFGVTQKLKLFSKYPEEAYVTLFYDGVNAAERQSRLMDHMIYALEELDEAKKTGKKASIPDVVRKYFREKVNGSVGEFECDYDKWQSDINSKGYYAIASSESYSESEVNRIYHLRDAAEKQYSMMKSQLGYNVMRGHDTEGIESRFAACFVASIIRHEIMCSCGRMSIPRPVNDMVKEMDRIVLNLDREGVYLAVHSESSKAKELLYMYDILTTDLDFIANDLNDRLNKPVVSQTRPLPAHEKTSTAKGKVKNTSTRTISAEQAPKAPAKRGRPKGAKNKKTLEREKAKESESVKRGPGRPKGSKTLHHKETTEQPKRGRGRPKGSKDSIPRKKRRTSVTLSSSSV